MYVIRLCMSEIIDLTKNIIANCKFVLTDLLGYIVSIIVSNCQHCDKQQFQTLSCAHYTIFSVVKLDLLIRARLLDQIIVLEKNTPRVHLVLQKIKFSFYSLF